MKFEAVIEEPGGITMPFDAREVFGVGRVPVRARVNGGRVPHDDREDGR